MKKTWLLLLAAMLPAGLSLGDASLPMASIPGGTFAMGWNTNLFAEGAAGELPAHTVTLRSFYMGRTEVTKAQWDCVAAWAATNGYDITTNSAAGKATNHPAQTLTWYSAVKWCNARSEMEGRQPCYTVGGGAYRSGDVTPDLNLTNTGYRLPTEAEWEYAARGGSATNRFPWRDSNEIQHSRATYDSSAVYAYDTSPTRGYHPLYTNEPTPYTAPAGSFATNAYGLCDMAGNVWEWCWDWNGSYSADPATNPVGAFSGSTRITRGGSYQNVAEMARVTRRNGQYPNYGYNYYGFRVASAAGVVNPVITSGPAAGAVSKTNATITWQTDLAADSVVRYGRSAAAFEGAVTNTARATNHVITLTGLHSGATYRYRVESTTEYGGSAASGDRYFATISALPTNLVVQPLLVKSPYEWPVRFNVEASGGVARVEYYVDGVFAGISYPPYADFDLTPLSLTNLDLDQIRGIAALVYNLDGTVITQEAEWATYRPCAGTIPQGEFEVIFPPESYDLNIPAPSVHTALTFQVHAAQTLTLDPAAKTGSGLPGPAWDSKLYGRPMAPAKSVEFLLDSVSLGTVSNTTPGQPYLFELTGDILALTTGRHEFAAMIQLSNACSRRLTRQFHVTHQVSSIEVSREIVRLGHHFGVALTFHNPNSETIQLLSHVETLRGFQPIHYSSAETTVTSVYDAAENVSRLHMTFHGLSGELAAGATLQRPYEIVPVLSVLPDDYRVGGDYVTRYTQAAEEYQRGNTLDTWWVDQGAATVRLATAVSAVLSNSDYLVVTSPRNLAYLGSTAERDELLAQLARLARARDGVLGYYDPAPTIMSSYNSGEQLAAGRVFGLREALDELFMTYRSEERAYVLGYQFPAAITHRMPLALGSGAFGDHDVMAVGDVVTLGGAHTLEEILIAHGDPASPAEGEVSIYMYMPDEDVFETNTLHTSFGAGDGFAAGDVTTNLGDEVVVAQAHTGLIEIYSDGSASPVASFTSTFRAGDGLRVAQVMGNAREEIIIVRPGADQLDFYDLGADAAPVAPTYSYACALYSAALVAAGDMHGFGGAEIVVGDPDRDSLTTYAYLFDSLRGGSLFRLWRRDALIAADDVLLVADILPSGKAEVLVVRQSAHDGAGAGEIEVLPAGAASACPDRYGLDDLLNPHGAWAARLATNWVSEGYLLLVGETEVIPSFSVRLDTGSRYFALTLADADYANTAGNRERPELSMGRIIGSSLSALQAPVITSLGLDAGTNTLSLDAAYVVSGSRRGAYGTADSVDFNSRRAQLAGRLRSAGFGPVTEEWTEGAGAIDRAAFFDHAPGMNLITLAGHGYWDCWDIISAEDVNLDFAPTAVRPLVIANSCLTGQYSPGRSFAERWLSAGAAAYIGAIAESYGTPQLLYDFIDQLSVPTTLGRAFRQAKQRRNHFTCVTYQLYGDPKIAIDWPDRKAAAPRGPAVIMGPTNGLAIQVPMYSVTNFDGMDSVTLPDNLDLADEGQPIVPLYRTEVRFPAGCPVQDVALICRDGAHETNGWRLPVATLAGDGRQDLAPRGRRAAPPAAGWWPTNVFFWDTDKNADGSCSLFVTVCPLYYNSNTTAAIFYSNYTFSIDYAVSDIAINRLSMDKNVYDTNDTITALIYVVGTNAVPLDVVIEPVLTRTDEDAVLFLPLQVLAQVRGVIGASVAWDACDYPAGEYKLTVRCKTQAGTLLDYDSVYFTVGFAAAGATNVTIAPAAFNIGQRVDLSAQFVNRGDQELDADLVIVVRDAAGASVAEFRQSVSNWMSGASLTFNTNWLATLVPRNCEVYAYVLFDSGQGVQTRQADWADAPLVVESAEARGTNAVLTWPSVAGRTYRVELATNLVPGAFAPVATGISAAPPMNCHTSALSDHPTHFLRISEQW